MTKRAQRTEPRKRKAQILEAAITFAQDVGPNRITRDGVADLCDIASSTVAKYYRTMTLLKRAVLKEAIRLEIMSILKHCVSDTALDKFPELKRRVLKYLVDHI